ncbi:hypothetical protein GQ42DRAFT_80139 [Ramicandelaber brevisporus]|nr:hypothetical protein GQ42DRAFT_80139 [Ramicandelaber brevisporus]
MPGLFTDRRDPAYSTNSNIGGSNKMAASKAVRLVKSFFALGSSSKNALATATTIGDTANEDDRFDERSLASSSTATINSIVSLDSDDSGPCSSSASSVTLVLIDNSEYDAASVEMHTADKHSVLASNTKIETGTNIAKSSSLEDDKIIIEKLCPSRPRPTRQVTSNRLPHQKERAIYRMSLEKLKAPSRPLLEQILIYNFTKWYHNLSTRDSIYQQPRAYCPPSLYHHSHQHVYPQQQQQYSNAPSWPQTQKIPQSSRKQQHQYQQQQKSVSQPMHISPSLIFAAATTDSLNDSLTERWTSPTATTSNYTATASTSQSIRRFQSQPSLKHPVSQSTPPPHRAAQPRHSTANHNVMRSASSTQSHQHTPRESTASRNSSNGLHRIQKLSHSSPQMRTPVISAQPNSTDDMDDVPLALYRRNIINSKRRSYYTH